MKSGFLIPVFLLLSCLLQAQEDTTSSKGNKEKIKTGWTWGALPVVAYDADMGFQYGALGQVFYFGDGSTYPEYRHTIYAEISRFTKGSGVNQVFYDSKYLIPGHIRITLDLSYLTERMLDFYGFNGYESYYDEALTDEGSDSYISRVFYRHERNMLRLLADFQGRIIGEKFRWLAGVNYFDIKVSTVDINKINKGKKEDDKLPDVPLLYDQYSEWGIIKPDEKNGGSTLFLKVGLVYDTRDNEPAPNKGMWTELMFLAAPGFLGNRPYAFSKLVFSHRQYFTLVDKYLVAAYRLAYQGTVIGEAPFYIQPYLNTSFALTTKTDGLGGSRTIRGVFRNRAVGDGIAYGNVELRWKFWRMQLFKQNFYLGLLGFLDGGQVVRDHPVDRSLVPGDVDQSIYFDGSKDHMHFGAGLGLRAVLNDNFMISFDYGFALDPQDGASGLYIGIGNIF